MARVATTPSTTPQQTSQPANAAVQIPHDKIAMRAYEKWVKRGRPHGTDKQDWIEAENELRAEMSRGVGKPMPSRR
jgi:Protein of unknown function (DUF2934)